MASRPRVLGSTTRTMVAEPGTPLVDDQIRDYRNAARAAYEAQRVARQTGNIIGRIVGRQPREHTLAMIVDPNSELERSLAHRARTIPAEVLYMTQRGEPTNRVYRNRTEERMLVTQGQQDRSFILQESYEALLEAGFEYIHLGVLQVRIQIMHRSYAGTMALVVFRDTRWTQEDAEDRSIIAAMEADLSQGHQLIYVIPDIMMTIRDFYQHIQISILTKGYNGFQGESNLLVTRSCRCRLSNVPNVGFQYNIQNVVEFLKSKGVKALNATKISTKKFQGGEWNIKPSEVVVPMQPTRMITRVNYDSSRSIRFGDYEASTSSAPPTYSTNDDEDEVLGEIHQVNMITFLEDDDEFDYPQLAALEQIFAPESRVGEEDDTIIEFLDNLRLSDEEEEYNGDNETETSTPRSKYNIFTFEDDYPQLQKLDNLVLSTNESAISSYNPGDIDMEGVGPGYAPATGGTSYTGAGTSDFPYPRRPRKWENSSEWFNLPMANARQASVFIMPQDFDTKVFERWESSVLLHMTDKIFDDPQDKLTYIENLLGESEKKMFITWRMKFTTEYEEMRANALGSNGTQNILNQIRMIFFLENPQVGTTNSQDAAYKTLKQLVCTEMSGPAIYRYLNDYFHLSAKSGRAWASEELSKEFFTKLPKGLGDRVEKSFKEKYPNNTIGVAARITFTRAYMKEICQEAVFQSQLKRLDFCKGTPVHGLYGKDKSYGRRYGVRKSTSYKGKPHKSHVRIDKKKHLTMKKKDCKCFACGDIGHFASECPNPKKLMHRVQILQSLELEDGIDVISVGFDESDVSDIYSVSEGEDNYQFKHEDFGVVDHDVFMMTIEERNHLVPTTSEWRAAMKVTKEEYLCLHQWEFSSERAGYCRACKHQALKGSRADCSTCEITICSLCKPHYYKDAAPIPVQKKVVKDDWMNMAKRFMDSWKKAEDEKMELKEELNDIKEQIKFYKGKEKEVCTEEIPQIYTQKLELLENENSLLKDLEEERKIQDIQVFKEIQAMRKEIESLKAAKEEENKAHEEEKKALKEEILALKKSITEIQKPVELVNNVEEHLVLTGKQRNNLLNIKITIEIKEKKITMNAILDTGAAICVCDGQIVDNYFRRPSMMNAFIKGVNGITNVQEILEEGRIWIGNQWFRIPRTYVMPQLSEGLHFIIGMNFIRAMEGGIRIEQGIVTFYKMITQAQAPPITHDISYIEELELELPLYYDICAANPIGGMFNSDLISPAEIQKLKDLGYIGEEPLKHWAKNQVRCRIEVKNPDLIIEDRPLKHVTPAMKESMKRHVDKLLELKVIRPSESKHRTTAIIVQSGTEIDPLTGKEKRGKERLVFNYKRLNDNTEKDQYSLPGINTIISRIGNSKIYSKFDLKSGFHQVAMDPESIPWTAFWAIDGLYEWLVMPFGLKNAPAIFQRKMDNCFRGTEEFIAVYIDDILIFSDNISDHRKHLKKFLEICKANGLVLSPTKMKIGTPEIDFLGATIGNSKIKLQPHIIKKVIETRDEELKEVKGLRKWLGVLNYARAYIPNLGKTLGPLYSKTSGNGERRMNSQDWKIVQNIKTQVQRLPDLEIPPTSAIMILETDGCMEGWGGICKWKAKPSDTRLNEKICAYASGSYNPIKSTIDAEVHAVINSLEKFKIYYLDKKELIIRTDSQAIVAFYKKQADHKPSRTRWLMLIDYITGLGINVKFEHIDGKENVLADTLSRLVQVLITKIHHPAEEQLVDAVLEVLKNPKEVAIKKVNHFILLTERWIAGFKDEHPVNVLTLDEETRLRCSCQDPITKQGMFAALLQSHTATNPGRWFYKCERNRCHLWIWKDLLDQYANEYYINMGLNSLLLNMDWPDEESDPLDPPSPARTEDIFDLANVSNDD
nr:polyprotein [Banana streak IM virus]